MLAQGTRAVAINTAQPFGMSGTLWHGRQTMVVKLSGSHQEIHQSCDFTVDPTHQQRWPCLIKRHNTASRMAQEHPALLTPWCLVRMSEWFHTHQAWTFLFVFRYYTTQCISCYERFPLVGLIPSFPSSPFEWEGQQIILLWSNSHVTISQLHIRETFAIAGHSNSLFINNIYTFTSMTGNCFELFDTGIKRLFL